MTFLVSDAVEAVGGEAGSKMSRATLTAVKASAKPFLEAVSRALRWIPLIHRHSLPRGVCSGWLGGWTALSAAQQAVGQAPSAPANFLDRPSNTVLTAVVTAVVTALLTLVLTTLFKEIGHAIKRGLRRLAPHRTAYLQALGKEHEWLKLIGVSNRVSLRPPLLREVYVSLRLTASRAEVAVRMGWEQILSRTKDRQPIVFLGSPGSGKSTLLDYLVLVFTGVIPHGVRAKLGNPLPLFGSLCHLAAGESLSDLLARSGPVALPVDLVKRKLRRGGCLVLLDGLDEVLDEAQQVRAVEEVRRLALASPKSWFVLTCRESGWRSNWLPDSRVFVIKSFDRDAVQRFIGVWYREVLRTEKTNALGGALSPDQLQAAESTAFAEARERSEGLWLALEANEALLQLAATPLLLSLIILEHYHCPNLLRERGKLYGQCLEFLLELWDKHEKKLKLDGACHKGKRLVLQEVAFHFLKERCCNVGLPDLERVLTPVRQKLPKDTEFDRLISQIGERSGILVEQKPRLYGFAYRALQAFLSAEHIVAHGLDNLLLAHVGEEAWREVILIAVSLVPPPRAKKLVQALLVKRDGKSGAELEMAGLCLAEGVQLEADQQTEVKQRLLERLDREEQAGTFTRLAGALRLADLGEAQRWMDEQLRQGDPGRQRRVLELMDGLGEEQGKSFAPLLLCLLGDSGATELVRARAAMALSRWPGIATDGAVWEVLRQTREARSPMLRQAGSWAWCEFGRAEELGFVKVPAGEFLMGSPKGEGDPDERLQHSLNLSTFYVGRDPVTEARFREYLGESGRRSGSHSPGSRADHPVANVTWHEALEYAEWHGWTLPSEAEWEKAARGPDGRRWPWGDEWARSRANSKEAKIKGTTPVGKYSPAGDSPYGCRDMAGNVREWTRSLGGRFGLAELPLPLRGRRWPRGPEGAIANAPCAARWLVPQRLQVRPVRVPPLVQTGRPLRQLWISRRAAPILIWSLNLWTLRVGVQLQSRERIEVALALYLIVAWRVLYLTRLGRVVPDLS